MLFMVHEITNKRPDISSLLAKDVIGLMILSSCSGYY